MGMFGVGCTTAIINTCSQERERKDSDRRSIRVPRKQFAQEGIWVPILCQREGTMGAGGGTGIDDSGEKVTRGVYPEHVV